MRKLLIFLKYAAACAAVLVSATAIYVGVSLNHLQFDAVDGRSVEAVAEELVERQLLPSISYAVIKDGDIQTVKTFGSVDMKSGEQADARTLYEAASLTKPFVAEIARQLFADDVYDLDENIADTIIHDRIADGANWQRLTPRHLLSHTSGLPNWSGDSRDPSRQNQLIFEFEPGSAFQYSGEGYGILLAFLEKKSGQTAEDLAADLFNELGMTNSTLVAQGFDGQYARGHWGKHPSRSGWKTNQPIAAYSMFTNASDYGLFLQYVIETHSAGLATNDPFIATQTKIKTTRSDETLGWSLGWGTLQRANDIVYFQWGDNGAFRSFAAFDPISKNGIVFFANGSFGTIYTDELAAPILGDIRVASSWFSDPKKEIGRTWLKF